MYISNISRLYNLIWALGWSAIAEYVYYKGI